MGDGVPTDSSRRILRSSAWMGLSYGVVFLVGLLRTKFLAVMLGPTGVGLLGLVQSFVGTATTAASLGFDAAGVREVARTADHHAKASWWVAMRLCSMVLAVAAVLTLWLCRDWILSAILLHRVQPHELVWILAAVAVGVLALTPVAWLTGLQRTELLAGMNISVSLIGTASAIVLVWLWHSQALVPLVAVTAVLAGALGAYWSARAGGSLAQRSMLENSALVRGQALHLVRMGLPIVLSGLMGVTTALCQRILIQREMDVVALGVFQASASIGALYLGFVLTAMGSEYYPRLAAALGSNPQVSRMVNEQCEMVLLIAAPVLLLTLSAMPWLGRLLYTDEFASLSQVLGWQVVGDVLKLGATPLAYLWLASGRSWIYLLGELLAFATQLGITAWLVPRAGLAGAGVAYVVMYLVYLPLQWAMARRVFDFRWYLPVVLYGAALLGACLLVLLAGRLQVWFGLGLGALLSLAALVHAIRRLNSTPVANSGHFAAVIRKFGIPWSKKEQ